MRNNGYIGLKFGLIKNWHFEDDFYKENEELVHELNKLYDTMFMGCCDMCSATHKNENNNEIKIKLCDILDKFFELGIKIYNNFDNKTYKTKHSYRKYILNYNKD